METWGISDVGLVRTENQDAYGVKTVGDFTVAVVCDGMGGTSGGQLASRIAVDTYLAQLAEHLQGNMNDEQIMQASSYCIAAVNEAIRAAAAENPGYERMGTTLVSAVVQKDLAIVSNIGDSRAYRISAAGIEQITRDHSLVENMVERGDLTPQEARHHPNRNLITRALGPEREANPDAFRVAWKPGEFLLLCSDGLVNTVSDQEILFEVIHNDEPENCLERLIALSVQRGAPDNVTAVLLMNR
ncbi:MAG: Stp1/IreP family PP2C-type Ser/Thr phosphatase [Oscillospiraceae bacterium]|nr:Stp1/IreP family PP2C-type Ser/Thr phosphatase [Oscillospiraceae bacterium]